MLLVLTDRSGANLDKIHFGSFLKSLVTERVSDV
jgi:hypothetical protein